MTALFAVMITRSEMESDGLLSVHSTREGADVALEKLRARGDAMMGVVALEVDAPFTGELPEWRRMTERALRRVDDQVAAMERASTSRPAHVGPEWTFGMCESCETRPASKWCNGCVVEDREAAEISRSVVLDAAKAADRELASRLIGEPPDEDIRTLERGVDTGMSSNEKPDDSEGL